ncbi:MAG TPA: hypothetical protein DIC30_02485 [Oceanospirillales bacterium]|jgi:hypothetical protein|nr:hypothetical protein [Oceanospirillales bacterium]|tara:strand:+ start:739 stop:1320 length:582 start_codon:yes stop_codon:yes gene_type:complete
MTSDIHHYDNGKPLNRSEAIKRQIERDAARHFLRLYEHIYKTPMRNIWHNEPSKPDISCHLNGKPLDLEIAHLYASASEAKILTREIIHQVQGREEVIKANDKELELLHYLSDLVDMDSKQRLETALTRLLKSKAKKTYDSPRVWLVIRNASPLWKSKDFEYCINNFKMPKNPFEQIWLLPEFDGSEPPMRIF